MSESVKFIVIITIAPRCVRRSGNTGTHVVSQCVTVLQASLWAEPHQQPAGQAQHSPALALHGYLCALLHPAVGRQNQQLLQLRHLMEWHLTHAGNLPPLRPFCSPLDPSSLLCLRTVSSMPPVSP